MGSRFSCRNRDSVPDDHPTKFKVTNVDDEGLELSSGVMELTERELVLHLQQWDSVHWPYRCLRRCGYDSDLFCFESDHRCQKGQGLFRFKCSRPKEIFNLLEDWMRRNNIKAALERACVSLLLGDPRRAPCNTPPLWKSLPVPSLPPTSSRTPMSTCKRVMRTTAGVGTACTRCLRAGRPSPHSLGAPTSGTHRCSYSQAR